MSGCPVCDPAPSAAVAREWLYVWPSTPHTTPKLLDAASALGVAVSRLESDCLRLDLAGADPTTALRTVAAALLPEERDGTRALLLPAGMEPGLADFRRVLSLERLLAVQRHQWLVELLEAGRLETHFQPIVARERPTEVVAYECLIRGRTPTGDLIFPGQMFTAAKEAGLLFQLDLAARRRAVQAVAEERLETLAMINFTPTSIYDPATCLRSTVAAVAMHGLDPARIVFEILETEQADEDLLKSILAVYRSAGFQVAIDDFGVGFSSVRLIEALRPDFLKLDMSLIRGIDRDPAKADVASGLLEMAHGLGIRTIIEGIETAGEWAWVRESRADLVQGFFFAAPGNPPPPLSSTAPVA